MAERHFPFTLRLPAWNSNPIEYTLGHVLKMKNAHLENLRRMHRHRDEPVSFVTGSLYTPPPHLSSLFQTSSVRNGMASL